MYYVYVYYTTHIHTYKYYVHACTVYYTTQVLGDFNVANEIEVSSYIAIIIVCMYNNYYKVMYNQNHLIIKYLF